MQCPKCAAPLIVLEVDNVELDHCTACGGVWLDAGELELLLGEASNRDTLVAGLSRPVESREDRIRCPICRKKLDKVIYGEAVVLDTCDNGHGLWLDDGELRQVIEKGDFPENHRIYEIIRDTFGHVSDKQER